MRELERIDRILELIRKKWKENSDQRLGQLLMNYIFGNIGDRHTAFIFYQEDTITEQRLLANMNANEVIEDMKKNNWIRREK